MNISQTIQPWGNSVGIRLPKVVTERAGVGVGQRLDISLRDGDIILRPVKTSKSLDDLLTGITPDNLHTATSTGDPQGNEAW